ncbi:DnaJ-domain-containing protein [Xylariomycetidae sp. FL0641]|nr:DnaJ-domain-containing protein [Xylariomycetidae sp. FL0641]
MGAQQSSTGGGAAAQHDAAPQKTDYYVLLGVEHHATDDEIKKAYRRKALELHPDRNYGDAENATRRFAEVQSAYEVLSDPQERAWYDSHRDAILRGDDPADTDAAPEFHHVRLFTTDEIFSLIGRFNKNVPLDDSPDSFFTILHQTFDRLAQGEAAAADWEGLAPVEYPPFGSSQAGEAVAKAFYARWSNFATRLSFSWKDKWRLSDAPDRRIRRLMDKENKKLRDDAVREFNDAVRSLVAFVRKRDPRYVPNTQSEAERQKVLRDSAAAQAARSRAANQEKLNNPFAVPEWAQSRGDDDAHQGEFSESEEESEVEQIECVVCNKTFKSEKSYEAHEKSKKHLKAVQQLQRQMKKENASFDLEKEIFAPAASSFTPAEDEDEEEEEDEKLMLGDDPDQHRPETPFSESSGTRVETASRPDPDPVPSKMTVVASDEESEDDDYASRDAVEARLGAGKGGEQNPLVRGEGDNDDDLEGATAAASELSLDNAGPAKKTGKAKAKREKKAARQATSNQQSGETKCNVCNAIFDSRTKLFRHIEDEDHAAIKTPASNAGKGKKKKKKR